MVSAMALTGMWFGDPHISLYKYFLSLSVAITYTGIAMIHNDVLDLEIDKINAPHRVLPSGKVTVKRAYIYAAILLLLGTLAGMFLSRESIGIMGATLILSLLYNARLKKYGFIGNLTVGFTATSAFLYGDAVSAGWAHFWPYTNWTASIYLFLVSSLINTAREVCKGIMDVTGDAQYGVNTIAVRYGNKVAAILVHVLIGCALLFTIIPVFVTHIFGLIVSLAAIALLVYFLMLGIPLIKNPNYETASRFKNYLLPLLFLCLMIVVFDVIIKLFF